MADINKLKNEARREEQRENWARAIELYARAIRSMEADSSVLPDLSLYNKIGDLYLRRGDTGRAVQYYEQAVEAYASQDLPTNAIALCNKILRVAPGRAEVYRSLGRLHAATGLVAQARASFLEYAARMEKSGEIDEALNALKEFVELSADEESRLQLARQLARHERTAEAVDQLRQVWRERTERGADAEDVRQGILELDPSADPLGDGETGPPAEQGGEAVAAAGSAESAGEGEGEGPAELALPADEQEGGELSEEEAKVDALLAELDGLRERTADQESSDAEESEEEIAEWEESSEWSATEPWSPSEPWTPEDEWEEATGEEGAEDWSPVREPPTDESPETPLPPEEEIREPEAELPEAPSDREETVPEPEAPGETPERETVAEESLPSSPFSFVEEAPETGESPAAGPEDGEAEPPPTELPSVEPEEPGIELPEQTVPSADASEAPLAEAEELEGWEVSEAPLAEPESWPSAAPAMEPEAPELDVHAHETAEAPERSEAPKTEEELPLASGVEMSPEEILEEEALELSAELPTAAESEPGELVAEDEELPASVQELDGEMAPSAPDLPAEMGAEAALLEEAGFEMEEEAPSLSTEEVLSPEGVEDALAGDEPPAETLPDAAPLVEPSELAAESELSASEDLAELEREVERLQPEPAEEAESGPTLDGTETEEEEAEEEEAETPVAGEVSAAEEPAAEREEPEEPAAERDEDELVRLADLLGEELDEVAEAAPEPAAAGAPGTEDFDSMLSTFRDKVAETLSDEDAAVRRDLAVAYLEMGLYDEAMAELEVALRSPEHYRASLELYRRCLTEKHGDALGDAEIEERLAAFQPPEGTPEESPEEAPELGALLRQLDEPPVVAPERPAAPSRPATTSATTGRPPSAKPRPPSGGSASDLAALRDEREAEGDVAGALRLAAEVVELDPTDPGNHKRRVELAFRANDQKQVVRAYMDFGASLEAKRQWKSARSVYSRILDLDPGSREATEAIENLERRQVEDERRRRAGKKGGAPVGQTATAESRGDGPKVDLGNAVRAGLAAEDRQLKPNAPRSVLRAKSDAEFDFDAMLSEFRQKVAESVDESDAEAHLELGVAFKDMGMLDEAIREFQVASRAEGAPLKAVELLGESFIEKGQAGVAARVLQRAIEDSGGTDEDLLGVLYQLGVAFQTLEQWNEAQEAFERVLSVNIDYRDVSERLAACSS